MGGKYVKIIKEVYIKKILRFHPLKKSDYLFDVKLKNEEGNDLMVDLIKICMNSLYGQSISKDIDEEYITRSEKRLLKKIDERVVDYEALPNGEYDVKNLSDPGIDKIKEVERSMPSHLSIFVPSQSKRITNKFVNERHGF